MIPVLRHLWQWSLFGSIIGPIASTVVFPSKMSAVDPPQPRVRLARPAGDRICCALFDSQQSRASYRNPCGCFSNGQLSGSRGPSEGWGIGKGDSQFWFLTASLLWVLKGSALEKLTVWLEGGTSAPELAQDHLAHTVAPYAVAALEGLQGWAPPLVSLYPGRESA